MHRRNFITLLGGAASVAWPLAARAQQPAMPVIGYLGSESADLFASRVRAFRQGLSDTGFVEGHNVAIEYRWADGQYERLPAMAAELVRRQVSVIVAQSTLSAVPAKAATTTIPIVFGIAGDPVAYGLVASLNRPGGNLTGATSLNTELTPKRLEVLHELAPAARIIALLVNPTNLNAATVLRDMAAAARTLGLELHVVNARTDVDITAAFASMVRLRVGGLLIGPDAFFNSRSGQIAALALHHGLPTIYQYREFAAAGGLMSYGGSLAEVYRLVGGYTGRILKGEKPADLPVQQATKIELIINMKTAKALGLTFPITLLGRADEVIE